MSFVGGKLKLKGGVDLPGKNSGKKKKKRAAQQLEETNAAAVAETVDGAEGSAVLAGADAAPAQASGGSVDGALGGPSGSAPPAEEDRRTEAEKKFEAHAMKYEAERAKKAAAKSHRERIKELNEKLATLTEHHDIPRISYSYM